MSPSTPDWNTFRRRTPLAPDDVVVHLVPFDTVSRWALNRTDCLSQRERAAAAAHTAPELEKRHLIAWVVARHLVGARLGQDPASVPLARHESGRMEPIPTKPPLSVSLSRCSGWVAVATAHRPVGVDVEDLQNRIQAEQLIRVLHPSDRARLQRLPRGMLPGAVTDAWTRKEALLKALGVGLNRDPGLDQTGRGVDRGRHPDGVSPRWTPHARYGWPSRGRTTEERHQPPDRRW